MKMLVAVLLALFSMTANGASYVSAGLMTTDYNVPMDKVFNSETEGYELTAGDSLFKKWLFIELALSDNGKTEKTNHHNKVKTLSSKSIAVLFHGVKPLSKIFALHARCGLSATTFHLNQKNITDIGITTGAGVSAALDHHWSLELDYLQRNHTLYGKPFHMTHYQLKGVYTF